MDLLQTAALSAGVQATRHANALCLLVLLLQHFVPTFCQGEWGHCQSGPVWISRDAGCGKVQSAASQVTQTMPCCHAVRLPVRSNTQLGR